MDESPETLPEPEIPPPPPEIPRGRLWASLGIPPVITIIGTIILSLAFGDRNYGIEILWMLPVSLLAIIVCLVYFILAWRVRYRGRTLVLTAIGYFLGQVILCLCVWFGCCFAVLA